eukprot:gene2316-2624_t
MGIYLPPTGLNDFSWVQIRPGLIELHPEAAAIIVHYELQEVLHLPDGTQEISHSSQATKKVTVKSLNDRTDLAALAADVIDKCKLIHPSKAAGRHQAPAFLDELEIYLEGLYDEDITKRAAAAGMICQLFRRLTNLEPLLERDNLLSTLARLLREDGMKSLELATAIAGCFFACSCFKQLHRVLLDNQVGTLLMDLVALELQRSSAREMELAGSSPAALTARAVAVAAGQAPSLDDRNVRQLSVVVRQDRFLYVATATLLNLAEDVAVQKKMRKKDVVGLVAALLSRPHMELLLLASGFLRGLCVYVENKDRLASLPGLVPQLVGLTRQGCGSTLPGVVLRLLHNLSFDAGLRQQMIQAGLVQQAVQLLDVPASAPLAAGLLYQLSTDDAAKGTFVFCQGALARLHESIMRAMGPGSAMVAGGAGGDGHGFNGFAGATGGTGGDLRSIPELIALAVNCTHSPRAAEWYCTGERLDRLLRRSLATGDELAWKLLHNLAVSGGQQVAQRLLVQAKGMLDMLQSPVTGPELFTEVLGTLAAACDACSSSSTALSADGYCDVVDGSSLGQLVPVRDLLALVKACLVPGALEDDALLEAVVLSGALAGVQEWDADLAASGLLMHLVELMGAKRADDEFVLQICWAFSKSLMQPKTTTTLLQHPQVIPYLIDLLTDNCVAVGQLASNCLDVIMDQHPQLSGTEADGQRMVLDLDDIVDKGES